MLKLNQDENPRYYLYRHIRLDSNIPFYIGIGTKRNFNTHKSIYERAYSKNNRNKYWNNITLKSDYKVEIVFESDTRIFIEQKEIEFINLYGRKDLNTGTLCNLTGGGDGGAIMNVDARKKVIAASVKATRKKVYQFTLKGNFLYEYESTIKAGLLNDIDCSAISRVANGKSYSTKGYRYSYSKTELPKYELKEINKIYQYDLNGKLINEYDSVSDIQKQLGVTDTTGIRNCLNGKLKTSYKYIWSYGKK